MHDWHKRVCELEMVIWDAAVLLINSERDVRGAHQMLTKSLSDSLRSNLSEQDDEKWLEQWLYGRRTTSIGHDHQLKQKGVGSQIRKDISRGNSWNLRVIKALVNELTPSAARTAIESTCKKRDTKGNSSTM